jgi:hypothetical protein
MSVFWTCQFQFCVSGGGGTAAATGAALVATPAGAGKAAMASINGIMAGHFFTPAALWS